jgi:hypothetical protein
MARVLSFVSNLFSAAFVIFLILGLMVVVGPVMADEHLDDFGLTCGGNANDSPACASGNQDCGGNGLTCCLCADDDDGNQIDVCVCWTTPCPLVSNCGPDPD